MAELKLPFTFVPGQEKFPAAEIQQNFDFMRKLIEDLDTKVETFNNLKIQEGSTVKFDTDTSGNVVQPSNPSFAVRLTSNQALTATTVTAIQCGTEFSDVGNHFDTSTYTFTAPVSGTYAFSFAATINATSGTGSVAIGFFTDFAGTPTSIGAISMPFDNASALYSTSVTTYRYLTAGTTVTAGYQRSALATGAATLITTSFFTGALVN